MGLTKGALSYHFPTKETLAAAITENSLATLNQLAHTAQTLSPNSGLRAFSILYVMFSESHCHNPILRAGCVLNLDLSAPNNVQGRLSAAALDVVRAFLQSAAHLGEINLRASSEAMAHTITMLLVTQHQFWMRDGPSLNDVFESLRNLLLYLGATNVAAYTASVRRVLARA